ncbi:FKBP-type peptidyl-prolyl cis-trans isomerase [Pendulispora brunnea]|uniref:Peptidyl-prolyl cis-trans isomerase n=1 Tax=Pendulispora brunnea TaxID=2905690 RepID=A0ABZ2KNW3_9BACT
MEIVDEVVGTGREAKSGDKVKVHYTGTLMNGKKFDSSRDRGDPFEFKLGAGSVIKGWDQGVVGMKIGGKRKLTIPYDLAYGEAGHPPDIPAKAALKFDVELIAIE